eukprot:1156295-Pelagomonas_calceolata.AAC.10
MYRDGSARSKGPGQFWWLDATMVPSYSYIVERVDLHPILSGFLRTPPATLEFDKAGFACSPYKEIDPEWLKDAFGLQSSSRR